MSRGEAAHDDCIEELEGTTHTMHADASYEDQRESARRAFARVFVAGLARRMARSGLLRALARALAGHGSSLERFPSRHLHTLCDRADLQPLRLPGVAAGGAGGGGPGDNETEVSFLA